MTMQLTSKAKTKNYFIEAIRKAQHGHTHMVVSFPNVTALMTGISRLRVGLRKTECFYVNNAGSIKFKTTLLDGIEIENVDPFKVASIVQDEYNKQK